MANKRIAGITIEIGGDTTKLQTALKGVDSQLAKTQSNLKDINKLLKVDPGNVDLLKQKYKNLQSSIDTTKTRLKTLKDAQKEALTPEQYDALQREIIETEQNLKSLEQEYKDFGSVAKQKLRAVGDQLKTTGEKITNFGKNLTTHVTAPIVGVGAAAYKAFTEVDEGLDAITKKTGATGEKLEEMGGIMENIAATIPTDFKTAGDAVGEVNTRFGLTGKDLEDLSAKFIKFAQLNDADVSASIDGVQSAMAAFNVDTSRAGVVLDILNKAAQDSGVPVGTLTQLLEANGPAMREMGFSIRDATGFLANLDKAGIDTSTVMGGLRKALKKATKDGKPLDKALDELQESMAGAATETEAAQIASELFGDKAGPAIARAVREGRLSFDALSSTVTDYGDNVENTFEGILDPADDFKVALNNLKRVGADIAKVVMPALSTAINKVKDVIIAIKEKWDGLTESQQETILKVAGIVAAIGPVIAIIGKVTSGIGSLIGLLTGPAGIAVAIGAVVAAGVYMVTHWEEVKEKAAEIWEKIKDFFVNAWEKIKEIDWAAVGKTIWNGIVNVMSTIGKWLYDRFNDAVALIKKIDWAQLGKDIWNWIKAAFAKIGEWFKKAFDTAAAWIKSVDWAAVGKYIWDWIKNAFATIGAWFNERFKAAAAWIKSVDWAAVGKYIWDWIKNAFAKIGEWYYNVFKTAAAWIKSVDWAAVGNYIWDWIKNAFSKIGEWFNERFKAAAAWIKSVDWAAVGIFIWDWIKAAFAKIGSWFKDKFDTAVVWIKSIDWGAVGKYIWDSIKNAITGVGKWFKDKFEKPINDIIALIDKLLGRTEKVEKRVPKVLQGAASKLGVGSTSGSSRTKHFYGGGVLGEGERATVGEYAPEYLTVKNGQAVVTPIPGAERWGGGGTINNNITINQLPGENANALAERVVRIMTRQQQQRNNAYA